jgi:predicted O-methyltransferase YrrM
MNYIFDNSTPEEALLAELERETHLRVVNPRMISGHIQGRLLEMMLRMLRPQNVLEIGTFTGYSTLCIAAGLDDGAVVDTIEIDDELEDIAASFFARSPHGHKIHRHTGDALEIAPTLGKTYDLIFIDGDKRQYPEYLEMAVELTRTGGFILADNVLWYGKVLEPAAQGDLHTRRLQQFNEMVAADPRLENIIIPLRDGINIIRKL